MTATSDTKQPAVAKKPSWPDQRERFCQLQAHKLRWWEALLSQPAFAAIAAAYIRRCTNEKFQQGKGDRDAAKRAVALDPYTEISSALLFDLDEIEIGHPPIRTHEIFEEIRKDVHQRALFDALSSKICADAPELHALAASVRREAIAYRMLHDELVTANLGLVHGPARRRQLRLPHEDLASEAVFGLMKAVHHFEPERGFQFSTIAVSQIRASVSRLECDEGTTVRVPINVQSLQYRIRRALPKLDGNPTDEELRDAVNADGVKLKCSVRDIALARQATITSRTRSLDAPLDNTRSGETDLALIDIVPDDRPLLDEQVGLSLEATVNAILIRMPRRDADAFRWATGLDDHETLDKIAKRHGLSRARIGQLAPRAVDLVRRELAKKSSQKSDAIARRSSVDERPRTRSRPATVVVASLATTRRPAVDPRGETIQDPSIESIVDGVTCESCSERSAEPYTKARLMGWRCRWVRGPTKSWVQLYRCPSCAEEKHTDIVVSDRYASGSDPLTFRCYECELSVTMVLSDARRAGWVRFKVDDETRQEVCPTCVISEGYLSEAQMRERHHFWEGGGLAANRTHVNITCDVCQESVAESSKAARLSGWRKRWHRDGKLRKQQDVCPGCVRRSGNRSRAPKS